MQRENKWQDRFDKVEKYYCPDLYSQPDDDNLYLGEDIKSFIQSEIDTAIAEERNRIIEEVEKHEWFELNSDWDFIKNEVINKDL